MSIIGKKEGLFNNAQRYSVTNIMDEDLTFTWGGNPFTIKANKSVSLPEYLANSVVEQMVDKILQAEMKANEVAYYERNPNAEINRYRSPNFLNNPNKRKELEEKICQPLALEKGSTEAQLLALQIREELERDISAQVSTEPPPIPTVDSMNSQLKEFAKLDKKRGSLKGAINESNFTA